jgi:hypothetical protein
MAVAVSSMLEFVGRTGNRSHKLLISTYKCESPVANAPGFFVCLKLLPTAN